MSTRPYFIIEKCGKKMIRIFQLHILVRAWSHGVADKGLYVPWRKKEMLRWHCVFFCFCFYYLFMFICRCRRAWRALMQVQGACFRFRVFCLHCEKCVQANRPTESIEFFPIEKLQNRLARRNIRKPKKARICKTLAFRANSGFIFTIHIRVFASFFVLCNFSCQTRQTTKENKTRERTTSKLAKRNHKFLCRKPNETNATSRAELGSFGRGIALKSRKKQIIFFCISFSICFSFRCRRSSFSRPC